MSLPRALFARPRHQAPRFRAPLRSTTHALIFTLAFAVACALSGSALAAQQSGASPMAPDPDPGGNDTQAPQVFISPSSATANSVAVTVTWCDNASLTATSRKFYLNGTLLSSSSFTYASVSTSNCPIGSTAAARSTGTVTLANGSNTFQAMIEDALHNTGSKAVSYTRLHYTPQVTPDGLAVTAEPNAATSYAFSVQNTGNAQAIYSLSVSCSGAATACSAQALDTVAAGATSSVPVSYTPGARGSSGTVTLTASNSTNGAVSNAGSINVSVPHIYTVDVRPDEAVASGDPNSSDSYQFRVKNTGSVADTFNLQPFCSTAGTCSVSPTKPYLASGDSVIATATYPTGAAGSITTVRLRATYARYSTVWNEGALDVQVQTAGATPPTVTVLPIDTIVGPNTTSMAITVQWCDNGTLNKLTAKLLFDGLPVSSIYSNGQRTGCNTFGTSVATVTMPSYGRYSVNATIEDSEGALGSGFGTVTRAFPSYAVRVTPRDSILVDTVARRTNYTQRFFVKNIGNSTSLYTLSSLCRGVISCTLSNAITVAPGESTYVDLAYLPSGTGVDGRAQLFARHDSAGTTWADSGWVKLLAPRSIAITPDNGAAAPVAASGSATALFDVGYTGPAAVDVDFTVSCSGSAVPCSSPASMHLIPGQSGVARVSYNAGALAATGTLKLIGKVRGDVPDADSGYVTVTPGGMAAPLVNLTSAGTGPTIERGLCLRVALNAGGIECGDLRLAHGLPAVSTLSKIRAPTLLYSSAHAAPRPIVRADVDLPAGAGSPDSVTAVLRIAQVIRARGAWAGQRFTPGKPMRIGLTFSPQVLTETTGLYPYQLEVTSWYPSGPLSSDPATGSFALVNRIESPFGAGWWLAGLERLHTAGTDLLWVAGDGSTRLYVQDAASPNVYRAPELVRPDSLTRQVDGTGATIYVRHLRHGASVRFDAQLRHSSTINRLGQATQFLYQGLSDTLHKVVLPANGLTKEYKFDYVADTVRIDAPIPSPTAVRRTTIVLENSTRRVVEISDPDGTGVSFGYSASGDARAIDSRVNRRGYATVYRYDAAVKVTGDSVQQTTVARVVRPAESLGLNLVTGDIPTDTGAIVTTFDGPRRPSDAVDRSMFWINRFGALNRPGFFGGSVS